ncbi:MAG: Ppx/GppA phosphatase family protein [Anaerolineales bacterium]|nr:Ppx/GppA family phosphatase [Anaerolineales bacterium]MCS7247815.1 Ppx/GppA family phosphatase [Anaerolineales bacterium]MDW8161625.1 Ppx/GppA phosphatase family protein [Anaerolineales bacterium]MDW8446081.1 Ppx/GppA phosphatase family protein [Anaerolineales bacterium]
MQENLAAIDIGSNAIRMAVARLDPQGNLEVLENTRVPVRLGKDAFTLGYFTEETIQMAIGTFLRFRNLAQVFNAKHVRAVGTSALREASNSHILIDRIASQTGFQVEVISEIEEARLIHLAVQKVIDLKNKRALLIDIGGGSVEVTLSNENVLSVESYALGTVRLLSKLEGSNGRNLNFNQLVSEYAEKVRRRIQTQIGAETIDLCVATGGNPEEMGRLRKRLFKGAEEDRITLSELEKLILTLERLSLEERIEKLRLRPDRADVLLPAAVVLRMIAKVAQVKEILTPSVGLKDGLLLEMSSAFRGPPRPRRDQIHTSAIKLGQKYQFDEEHARFVAKFATRLFLQSLSLHHLTEKELLILEAAAYLHDIGHFINTIDHDQHGYYILLHTPLLGLSPKEQEILAHVVRYHRRESLSSTDEVFKSLSQSDRAVVSKLCAIMQIADALDISHTARLQDLILEQHDHHWKLILVSPDPLLLEKWWVEKKKSLFQEVFGVQLTVEVWNGS